MNIDAIKDQVNSVQNTVTDAADKAADETAKKSKDAYEQTASAVKDGAGEVVDKFEALKK